MIARCFRTVAPVLLLGALASTASAQRLDPVLQRVAAAWHRADVGSITSIGAESGITIDVDGNVVGPLNSRQAAAPSPASATI